MTYQSIAFSYPFPRNWLELHQNSWFLAVKIFTLLLNYIKMLLPCLNLQYYVFVWKVMFYLKLGNILKVLSVLCFFSHAIHDFWPHDLVKTFLNFFALIAMNIMKRQQWRQWQTTTRHQNWVIWTIKFCSWSWASQNNLSYDEVWRLGCGALAERLCQLVIDVQLKNSY